MNEAGLANGADNFGAVHRRGRLRGLAERSHVDRAKAVVEELGPCVGVAGSGKLLNRNKRARGRVESLDVDLRIRLPGSTGVGLVQDDLPAKAARPEAPSCFKDRTID